MPAPAERLEPPSVKEAVENEGKIVKRVPQFLKISGFVVLAIVLVASVLF